VRSLDNKYAPFGNHRAEQDAEIATDFNRGGSARDPWNSSCPSRELIDTLASKWVLLLIPLLRTGSRRNNDLMRTLQGISQKMLTQTLRSLEERRIVTRHDFKEIPPRVEYGLTPLGRSLARALTGLDKWVAENYHLTTSSRETQSQRRK
jgi:DNA-binding HxlR family transcriptional regulator